MVKVFFVEDTGKRIFNYSWWCRSCNTVACSIEISRGTEDAFPEYPKVKPKPVACKLCGSLSDFISVGANVIWVRPDTGEEFENLSTHPGACYENPTGTFDRVSRIQRFGPDGRSLTVICPNGQSWIIDSRASNCTMPHDNDHRCWVRHGSPEIPESFTVDKRGYTCEAGSGSIAIGNYHGFLTNGVFRE